YSPLPDVEPSFPCWPGLLPLGCCPLGCCPFCPFPCEPCPGLMPCPSCFCLVITSLSCMPIPEPGFLPLFLPPGLLQEPAPPFIPSACICIKLANNSLSMRA